MNKPVAVTLIAAGHAGLRAAAWLAGAGIPSRVLCVGWDPESWTQDGPSTPYFSAETRIRADLERVFGSCIVPPSGLPWSMDHASDDSFAFRGRKLGLRNRVAASEPGACLPILGVLAQLQRQASAVFDAGGDVIPDVVVQEIEATQGCVEAVLTEHGREYVHGRLWCDATPRRILRWMDGCAEEAPRLAASLRCADRIRITGRGVMDPPCWVMHHPSPASTDWRFRMWPGLWPGLSKWTNWVTVEGTLAPRHPWALLPEQDLARTLLHEWGEQVLSGDGDLHIDIQRNVTPHQSVADAPARMAYLSFLEAWGVCPIGAPATFQVMDVAAELGWVRTQMGV